MQFKMSELNIQIKCNLRLVHIAMRLKVSYFEVYVIHSNIQAKEVNKLQLSGLTVNVIVHLYII